ncbi:MAG: hypothetical protein AAF788_05560 [Pseudomonadota bacterium]
MRVIWTSAQIGSYSALQVHKNTNTASGGRIRQLNLVIRLLDQEEFEAKGGFDALDTYIAMSDIWINR